MQGRGLTQPGYEGAGRLVVPVGIVDKPFEQRRDTLWCDFSGAAGHMQILGGPQSGKSTLLRSLMASFALTHTPYEVQLYGLDFGGGGMAAMAGLPHVGGVASRLDPERVRRTVAEVYGVMTRREEYFRSAGIASIADYRARRARGDISVTDQPWGDVFLVIDGWGNFRSDYEGLEQVILEMAARGLGYGVHLVLTASRSMEVRANLKDHLMNRLELRLGDTMDSEFDRKVAVNVPTGVPGRGQSPQKLHFMGAVPRIDGLTSDTDLAEATAALATEVSRHWQAPGAPEVRLLPREFSAEQLPPGNRFPQRGVAFALDEDNLGPVFVDFEQDPFLLVFGESGSAARGSQASDEHQRARQAGDEHQHAVDDGGGHARAAPRPAAANAQAVAPSRGPQPATLGSTMASIASSAERQQLATAERRRRRCARRAGRWPRSRRRPRAEASTMAGHAGAPAARRGRRRPPRGAAAPSATARPGRAPRQEREREHRRDERRRDERHRRPHRRRQREEHGDGEAACTTWPAARSQATARSPRPTSLHVAAVADAAVDVADDPAGQREVEEHRAVVGRHGGGQRQADAEAAGHDRPAPGAADASSPRRSPPRRPAPRRRPRAGRRGRGPCRASRRRRRASRRRPRGAPRPTRSGSSRFRSAKGSLSTVRATSASGFPGPSRQDEQVGVAHGDGEAAPPGPPPGAGARTRRRRPPARAPARTAAPTQPASHSAVSSASSAPSRQGLGRTSTSAPRRRNAVGGGVGGVRAEQAAAHRRAALVGVEGGRHAGVERVGRRRARRGRRPTA